MPAHRVVLAAASDYFAAMFGGEMREAGEAEVAMKNVDGEALEALVSYAYTGEERAVVVPGVGRVGGGGGGEGGDEGDGGGGSRDEGRRRGGVGGAGLLCIHR